MVCQLCKKEPATVHIKNTVNGQVSERHLCEACARKEGMKLGEDLLSNFAVNLLSGFIEMQLGGSKEKREDEESAASCPSCGQSYRQLQRTGRLGCADCYHTFRPHLDPLLRRVHGATMHRGKIPHRSGKAIEMQRRISDLRVELQRAIAEERFEAAAQLRDEVKALERTVLP